MTKKLPKGFQCPCGTKHRFPLYVYAHWRYDLRFKCECGQDFSVFAGQVEDSDGKMLKSLWKEEDFQ